MRNSRLVTAAIALAILLPAVPVAAQSVWSPRIDGGHLHLEVSRTSIEGVEQDPASMLAFLTVRVPLSPAVAFVGDAGFSNFDGEGDYSSTSIANPYLGVELGTPETGLTVRVGLRLPLIDEDEGGAIAYGLYGDLHRWEAWIDEAIPLSALFTFREVDERGFGVRVDLGPAVWLATGDRDDSEVFAVYAAQLVFEGDGARVNGGFNGRALLTEDDVDLGERTLHEFGLSASVRLDRVWPGLQFRVPLDDDLSSLIDWTLGLQVAVELD